MTDALSHVRPDGSAHMVDVSGKDVTTRSATATATLVTRPDVVARILDGTLPKGEVVGTARIAAIMAVKRTSDLIPLCHPLPISGVEVEVTGQDDRVVVTVAVRTTARTGVEMEALTGASVGALTVYDMVKAVDRSAVVTDVRVLEKHGGRSGDWSAS
ncbi:MULTISPECIES: cyclic pyranopterin monophosphate synthase MoaC [unclassified Curtobacterium]|uniref:cyclic pyranopterin monophosphate synthase MoaC n=1 Tax=unclassified Curtobacterium TaxID=257496 RepID=UPI000DA97CD2|nr:MULTISPECIES: cyclic pyranopterin monophosphate synthase MoaC [unclassified Curtobacterium]PZE24735.1 cyclic pyranopterin monophosphate synthase MoaC [Curtobacterium sp. MCBD17_028]PZF60689.1 cyclic pyranopterin monophosphate synthase MoaC [Curtobacterium sp. MCBD17_013]WIB63022.1 cyclic pyranopterin monophosphate synthase MoaC [Curtobacterium sp. MCBD17_040]WIB66871.1 cyclic pyranopterin monophosphate synthase MoaC [Curtobacterium sp. MCBD17_035]WIE54017.1 cyclic pyranopterin monophosphate